jgi:hypothetical protein
MVNKQFQKEFDAEVAKQTKLEQHEDANVSNMANNILSVLALIAVRLRCDWYDNEDTFEHALDEAIADIVESDQQQG